MTRDRTPQILLAALAALLVIGFFLPHWAVFLVTIGLAKGLLVLGLLPMMHTGLVSFGQALYYCLGAYAGGSLGAAFGVTDLFLMMLVGGIASGALSLLLGLLVARYRGISFGLLSLALSMILDGLLVKTESLGSSDGFNVAHFTLLGIRPGAETVRYAMLAVAAVVCTIAALGVHRFLGTPLGGLGPAIRDNEIRVEYMGGSARYAIHVIYVISAVLAGISGALIFGAIHSFAFDFSPNTWQMVLGTALLLIIVFLPNGLWSLFGRRFGRQG